MKINQSLWILSSLMAVIFCGIGVLLMIDFDTTIRRIMEGEISIETMNTADSATDVASETFESMGNAPETRQESNAPEQEELQLEITPAGMKNGTSKENQDGIEGDGKRTEADIPQLARVDSV